MPAHSRKVKGSHNRERERKKVARIHKKTENQRTDYQWKLAIALCQKFDILFFEDLNLDGMKRLWGKQVSDVGFGEFMQKLKHQSKKRIRAVLKISRWPPTSKSCSVCNHKKDNLTLAEREWTCPKCKTHLDRDQNAAMNILKEGIASFGLGDVSPIVLLGKIVGYSVEATSPRNKGERYASEIHKRFRITLRKPPCFSWGSITKLRIIHEEIQRHHTHRRKPR